MSRKKKRAHLKKVAKHIRRMQRNMAGQKKADAAPEQAPEEPKELPSTRDNLKTFDRSPDMRKAVDEFEEKKDRVKAARLHEEFKKQLCSQGRTGGEVLLMLKAFRRKLKAELTHKTVRHEALVIVDEMSRRFLMPYQVDELKRDDDEGDGWAGVENN